MMVNLSSQDTIQAHFTFQGLHRPAPQRMLHMSSIYDFEALSISGQPMALSSYRGQVMLIVNGDSAHPLYKYLTAEAPGILESKGIKWNFTKFLIGKDGSVIKRYAPQDAPKKIVKEIEAAALQFCILRFASQCLILPNN